MQQNKVDRAMVKRAVVALRKVTPNVLGAVLNAVDVKSKAYYGYGYYGSRRERRESAERRAKDVAPRRRRHRTRSRRRR